MSRRLALSLLAGLSTLAGAALALSLVIRAATTPIINVSTARHAKNAVQLSPAEISTRKTIEGRYRKLAEAMSKPDPALLASVTTPDFIMERLFRDRIINYT